MIAAQMIFFFCGRKVASQGNIDQQFDLNSQNLSKPKITVSFLFLN